MFVLFHPFLLKAPDRLQEFSFSRSEVLWVKMIQQYVWLSLVYKSLNAKGPSYLSDLLNYLRSSYSLRSVSNGDLEEPSSKMRTYGDWSFAVCAPRLWNSLPLSIGRSSSVDIFKNVLKTYLFKMFISECL